ADPHSYLIVGLMDGTGNDADKDPLHATNVAKFRQQVRDLKDAGVERIRVEYIEGPGTQDEVLARTVDSATGRTSLARANEMYERLKTQSQNIFQADPEAKIAFHLEGFSRGASQVPLLARMIDARGIPNLKGGIRGIGEDGLPLYNRYHQPPGLTPMSVGLYDPVPTGYMELFDRRLPPSVVSGFQLSAAHERRGLFPVDLILPQGVSGGGRFLHLTVAGAHSDLAGTYLRGGIGVRSLNLMTDYHNGLLSEPLLPRMHEPTDARMNVIHRSEEGNVLFRNTPKMDRATSAGQVHQLTADYARYAQPGEVVQLPSHMPEPLHSAFAPMAQTARPVQRSAQLADAALTEGDALTARLLRTPGVELRPYPPPMLDRPGFKAAGALGVATTLYEATQSGEKIATLLSQNNPLAARSELAHFAGRNVGGWAGGTAAAYALGASGAGPMALIAADAYFMSKAGEKAADLLDNRAIYQQTDRQGVQWAFNGTAWSRDGMADATNDGSENPNSTRITASYEKARELNYQATNAAAELALRDAPSPQNPYRLPASDTDTPSLSAADWMRDASDGQWHRQIKTGIAGANDRGVYVQETAAPARAAELDAQAEAVIARNIANSPGAIAARYELAHHRSGWAADGLPLSDAMQQALPNPDALNASDGQQYRRDADGRWAGEGGAATGNLARELDTTRAILQPALAEHAQAVASIQQSPPSPQDVQREQTLYRYRLVGTELQPQWREAIELATQRTRETAGLSGDGAMQLQRGPGGVFGADSPIAHFQRGPDGVDRIAAVTSSEDIRQALSEVQAQRQARSSSADVLAQRPTSTTQAAEGSADSDTSSSNASASPQLVMDMQVRMQAASAAQARQERAQQERQAQEQQAAQVREHTLQAQSVHEERGRAAQALQAHATLAHQGQVLQQREQEEKQAQQAQHTQQREQQRQAQDTQQIQQEQRQVQQRETQTHQAQDAQQHEQEQKQAQNAQRHEQQPLHGPKALQGEQAQSLQAQHAQQRELPSIHTQSVQEREQHQARDVQQYQPSQLQTQDIHAREQQQRQVQTELAQTTPEQQAQRGQLHTIDIAPQQAQGPQTLESGTQEATQLSQQTTASAHASPAYPQQDAGAHTGQELPTMQASAAHHEALAQLTEEQAHAHLGQMTNALPAPSLATSIVVERSDEQQQQTPLPYVLEAPNAPAALPSFAHLAQAAAPSLATPTADRSTEMPEGVADARQSPSVSQAAEQDLLATPVLADPDSWEEITRTMHALRIQIEQDLETETRVAEARQARVERGEQPFTELELRNGYDPDGPSALRRPAPAPADAVPQRYAFAAGAQAV
ncbi:DUF2235 domain-containing protein, partial [Xanthomonas hortorum pv. pelargonii]